MKGRKRLDLLQKRAWGKPLFKESFFVFQDAPGGTPEAPAAAEKPKEVDTTWVDELTEDGKRDREDWMKKVSPRADGTLPDASEFVPDATQTEHQQAKYPEHIRKWVKENKISKEKFAQYERYYDVRTCVDELLTRGKVLPADVMPNAKFVFKNNPYLGKLTGSPMPWYARYFNTVEHKPGKLTLRFSPRTSAFAEPEGVRGVVDNEGEIVYDNESDDPNINVGKDVPTTPGAFIPQDYTFERWEYVALVWPKVKVALDDFRSKERIPKRLIDAALQNPDQVHEFDQMIFYIAENYNSLDTNNDVFRKAANRLQDIKTQDFLGRLHKRLEPVKGARTALEGMKKEIEEKHFQDYQKPDEKNKLALPANLAELKFDVLEANVLRRKNKINAATWSNANTKEYVAAITRDWEGLGIAIGEEPHRQILNELRKPFNKEFTDSLPPGAAAWFRNPELHVDEINGLGPEGKSYMRAWNYMDSVKTWCVTRDEKQENSAEKIDHNGEIFVAEKIEDGLKKNLTKLTDAVNSGDWATVGFYAVGAVMLYKSLKDGAGGEVGGFIKKYGKYAIGTYFAIKVLDNAGYKVSEKLGLKKKFEEINGTDFENTLNTFNMPEFAELDPSVFLHTSKMNARDLYNEYKKSHRYKNDKRGWINPKKFSAYRDDFIDEIPPAKPGTEYYRVGQEMFKVVVAMETLYSRTYFVKEDNNYYNGRSFEEALNGPILKDATVEDLIGVIAADMPGENVDEAGAAGVRSRIAKALEGKLMDPIINVVDVKGKKVVGGKIMGLPVIIIPRGKNYIIYDGVEYEKDPVNAGELGSIPMEGDATGVQDLKDNITGRFFERLEGKLATGANMPGDVMGRLTGNNVIESTTATRNAANKVKEAVKVANEAKRTLDPADAKYPVKLQKAKDKIKNLLDEADPLVATAKGAASDADGAGEASADKAIEAATAADEALTAARLIDIADDAKTAAAEAAADKAIAAGVTARSGVRMDLEASGKLQGLIQWDDTKWVYNAKINTPQVYEDAYGIHIPETKVVVSIDHAGVIELDQLNSPKQRLLDMMMEDEDLAALKPFVNGKHSGINILDVTEDAVVIEVAGEKVTLLHVSSGTNHDFSVSPEEGGKLLKNPNFKTKYTELLLAEGMGNVNTLFKDVATQIESIDDGVWANVVSLWNKATGDTKAQALDGAIPEKRTLALLETQKRALAYKLSHGIDNMLLLENLSKFHRETLSDAEGKLQTVLTNVGNFKTESKRTGATISHEKFKEMVLSPIGSITGASGAYKDNFDEVADVEYKNAWGVQSSDLFDQFHFDTAEQQRKFASLAMDGGVYYYKDITDTANPFITEGRIDLDHLPRWGTTSGVTFEKESDDPLKRGWYIMKYNQAVADAVMGNRSIESFDLWAEHNQLNAQEVGDLMQYEHENADVLHGADKNKRTQLEQAIAKAFEDQINELRSEPSFKWGVANALLNNDYIASRGVEATGWLKPADLPNGTKSSHLWKWADEINGTPNRRMQKRMIDEYVKSKLLKDEIFAKPNLYFDDGITVKARILQKFPGLVKYWP